MNNRSAHVVIDDANQQVHRANEHGDTHVSMLTLDVVRLTELASRGLKHEADAESLQQLQGYVRELCKKLGANPDEAPCDVWHLNVQIDQLRSELNLLANGWDLVGHAARAGWDEPFLDKLDDARDRALYPRKQQPHVQLPLPALLPVEARAEWAAAATEEERTEILKRYAKVPHL